MDEKGEQVKYATIVADPPWHYDYMPGVLANGSDHRVVMGQHIRKYLPYATMSLPEIKAIPVDDFAADDCRLFLWTTNKYLPHSFDVIAAWGFEYKQTIVWAKRCAPPYGGSVARQFTEYLLAATRGAPPRLALSRTNLIEATRAKHFHSRKPDVFADLIEEVSPGPYLELFARRQRLGWDTWGNEALNHVEVAS